VVAEVLAMMPERSTMTERRLFLKKVKTGREYDLFGAIPVGRDADDGIKLVDKGGSRRHATVSVIDGTCYVEDANSRNGTSVNGRRIVAKTALRAGDRVSFDTEEFEFQVDSKEVTEVHPAGPQKTVSSGQDQSPRSWAEVQFNTRGADGTERFDANQLKAYLAKAKERQQQQTQFDIKEPCLRISSGDQPDRTLPLRVDGSAVQEWTVGRSEDSAVRLDEPGVSERHAKIVREGARWKLLDAISSNGTFVNDLQVGMCYLASTDLLRFGRVQCVFYLPRRGQGGSKLRTGGLRKVFWIGLILSFAITLMILYWLFGSRFM
jgi:pSer/pThr/pTyr-binding forkhead associated (FHA) protein